MATSPLFRLCSVSFSQVIRPQSNPEENGETRRECKLSDKRTLDNTIFVRRRHRNNGRSEYVWRTEGSVSINPPRDAVGSQLHVHHLPHSDAADGRILYQRAAREQLSLHAVHRRGPGSRHSRNILGNVLFLPQ